MTTIDQFPKLDEERSLTAQQISEYQEKGHTLVRNAASPQEIDAYEPLISEWVKKRNNHNKPLEERDTYGKAFIQIGNLWRYDEALAQFTLSKRFAKMAADLMGVDSVRIYHDQGLYKEPGGGYTPWHQDQIYWPLDTEKTITMWMPLVPVSVEVGSMTFASESHRLGYINKMVISEESHRTLGEFIKGKGMAEVNYGSMAAGDATFHSGWTLHSAPSNPTEQMRKVMTVIYYADGTRIAEPDSNARRNDLKSWLPGLKPGDLAASELNPVVYRAE